jgi:hypothetical protein
MQPSERSYEREMRSLIESGPELMSWTTPLAFRSGRFRPLAKGHQPLLPLGLCNEIQFFRNYEADAKRNSFRSLFHFFQVGK